MTIYRHGPLEWPGMLLVHPGREFMGSVSKEMKDHRTFIRRGCTEIHGDRASAERFNKTVVEMLFSFQYGQQIVKTARPASWAKRLLEVVAYCSEQIKGETRLTGKEKNHQRKESLRRNAKDLLAWLIGKRIKESYQPQLVLESLSAAERSITKTDTPIVYYLLGGPKRGFVREDLLITPRHM
ncbi:hypothetical protein P5673_005893 [Acropora cervicornis]|uniref:Integrase catalytic domain-containing protein n=1 Tax=Acropora cervicornis TaxID=6130 RepID=A0AAD9VC23_ACRCE|nr:hypothetical protein P5673_005893 [Acropora cervicornis]